MAITTGEDHWPQVDIVERTARVGVLGHLDELERLARVFVSESMASANQDDPLAIQHRLYLSSFILWLRQRQRQSVAGQQQKENKHANVNNCRP